MTQVFRSCTAGGRLLRQLALLILFGWCAAAQCADDFTPELLERLERDGADSASEWLRGQQHRYRGDAVYYDWLSRFAMNAGDYRRAIPALERLIALEPRHLGGQLDLVLALQLEGRSAEARRELKHLHDLLPEAGELPEQARLQIDALDALLQPQRAPQPRQFSALVAVNAGHDSNANRGSDHDSLTIEFDGVPIELRLNPDSLKTADEFVEGTIHLEYGNRGNNCRFEACRQWQVGAYTRQYQTLSDYDQRHFYLATRKSYAGRYQREYGIIAQNVVSSRLEYTDGKTDEQNILGVDYRQRLLGRSHLTGAVKVEWIDEQRRNESDSLLTTLSMNSRIPLNLNPSFQQAGSHVLWELAASWHNRPGYFAGDTMRYTASASYPFRVGQWHSSVGMTFRWRTDEELFNPLFFGNTTRRDKEVVVSGQIQRQFGDWLINGRINYEKVASNIDLFDTTRLQAILGLAYQF